MRSSKHTCVASCYTCLRVAFLSYRRHLKPKVPIRIDTSGFWRLKVEDINYDLVLVFLKMSSIMQVWSRSARQNQIKRAEADVSRIIDQAWEIGICTRYPSCPHILCNSMPQAKKKVNDFISIIEQLHWTFEAALAGQFHGLRRRCKLEAARQDQGLAETLK